MTPFIKSLEIDGFRAFTGLRVDGLGKVNLITGKNNSGKSSLLEAIRILATGGALRTIYEILDYREELGSTGDSEKIYSPTDLAPFCICSMAFPILRRVNRDFRSRRQEPCHRQSLE